MICPRFGGVGLVDSSCSSLVEEKRAEELPTRVRRKVLDLLKAGRKVSDLVRDLQISDQIIYT